MARMWIKIDNIEVSIIEHNEQRFNKIIKNNLLIDQVLCYT